MKRYLIALALLLSPIGAHAATITVPHGQDAHLSQNEYAYFDVRDFDTFSLSFVNDAFWSGGSILATTDASNTTRPWEATHIGEWAVNFISPQAVVKQWAFDTTQAFMRFFTVGTYGASYVHANVSGPDVAPVPVPAAGLLLIGGMGLLAVVRRRKEEV